MTNVFDLKQKTAPLLQLHPFHPYNPLPPFSRPSLIIPPDLIRPEIHLDRKSTQRVRAIEHHALDAVELWDMNIAVEPFDGPGLSGCRERGRDAVVGEREKGEVEDDALWRKGEVSARRDRRRGPKRHD